MVVKTKPKPYSQFFLPPAQWKQPEAERADGVTVHFSDGTQALCGISGLWNASLGYGNLAIADAIDQANRSASTLPIFRRGSLFARQAAESLLGFVAPHQFSSVLYSTSGSAAVDAAIKVCRLVALLRQQPRRRRIISLVGSYHGMTFGAMSLVGADVQQAAYGVDERLVVKIPYQDLRALKIVLQRFGSEIAGVVLEPVLGSGALVVPDAMLQELAVAREEHHFVVVADEVATGFYRTGVKFASHQWPTPPDVLVLSKALTNGTCAASALLLNAEILSDLEEAKEILWHGETQAGSPQSCAAIIATIKEIDRLRISERIIPLISLMEANLAALVTESDRFSVSGVGMFKALHMKNVDGQPVSDDIVRNIVAAAYAEGALIQPGPGCIQLLPAFTYTKEELVLLLARVKIAVLKVLGL